jgi:hypothetical protein
MPIRTTIRRESFLAFAAVPENTTERDVDVLICEEPTKSNSKRRVDCSNHVRKEENGEDAEIVRIATEKGGATGLLKTRNSLYKRYRTTI